MNGDTRCIEGTLWRHDPQPDDPHFETDVGICPECGGVGCDDTERVTAMSSTELAIIRRAREIISDPERWTRESYARDEYGYSVRPGDAAACRWCALGAIAKAAIELDAVAGDGACAVDRLYEAGGAANTVVVINDRQGHAAVLALFDKALENAPEAP